MAPEIIALIEKPHLLIAILLVGAFAGMIVERFLSKMRRQASREKNRWRWKGKRIRDNLNSVPWAPKPDASAPKQPDAADQLRIVMGATFTIQPLLNKSEARGSSRNSIAL